MTVIYSAQSEAPESKTRSPLLPLLIVLFVISYAILTLLVVEQGRTIEVQRGLIREMLKDSTQLAALKGKLAREEAAAKSQGKPAPQTERQDPSGNKSKSGSAANSAPSAPGNEAKRQGKSRTMKEVPETPAADLQDVRRSKRII